MNYIEPTPLAKKLKKKCYGELRRWFALIKIMDWVKSIAFNSKTIPGAKHLNVKKMLTELII